VILAQDPAAGQRVLVQRPRFGWAAQLPQDDGQGVGRSEGAPSLGPVLRERALVQPTGQVVGVAGEATADQVPDRIAGEVAERRGAGVGVKGEQVG
jgi:hypothetical protein